MHKVTLQSKNPQQMIKLISGMIDRNVRGAYLDGVEIISENSATIVSIILFGKPDIDDVDTDVDRNYLIDRIRNGATYHLEADNDDAAVWLKMLF